ncbi:MAG: hypothetical protein ACK40O_04495 [Allosphingosinicella sp.]
MTPGIFIIAILGCGEAEAPCQPVRMLQTRYESQAACTAATEDALMRHSDADFPVIVAQCMEAGEAARVLNAGEVELPGPVDIDPRTLKSSPVRS